ncbi:SgcJ/EcaC family oxidoreductase [Pyxidicoccus parkwayensis]|uniref:SgcJ/EcaC family oxidoreductase n=1 Tax=Pyxidicoccus parkwayensis TaxID=2813578 RepID=UPI0027D9C0B0|nr:SgcJ/EcaC family oxidoreductase [Pyxidicoccus parkwaysis]
MIRARFSLATVAAVFLSLALSPLADAAPAGARTQDEAALRKLVSEQTEAWNRQDAAAWSKDFADDATFINIVGTLFNGRAEIEKRHAFVFDTLFKGSRSEVTVRKVLFLDGGVAMVDTEHQVTNYVGLPPGVQPTTPGVLRTQMRYVLKKTAGRWLIVAGQNTDVKPAPAPASAGTPPSPAPTRTSPTPAPTLPVIDKP